MKYRKKPFDIGETFGRLTVIEYLGKYDIPVTKIVRKRPNIQNHYKLRCECGGVRVAYQQRLIQRKNPIVECEKCAAVTRSKIWYESRGQERKVKEESSNFNEVKFFNQHWRSYERGSG